MRYLRLLLIPLTLIVFMLLLGAAVLIGSGSASSVVVAQTQEHRWGLVHYSLTDVDRQVTLNRELNVPDVLDESWYMQPPLVLQRETPGGVVHWTLNTVDVRRNTFSPIMRLTMPTDVQFRINNTTIRGRPDEAQQVTAYMPHSGEIWTSTSDAPEAVLLATVERNLDFPLLRSPDSKWLAVRGNIEMGSGLTLINVNDGSQQTFKVPESGWILWSSDSRYLLINNSRPDLDEASISWVIDTHDSIQAQVVTTTSLSWCANDLIAIAADSQTPEAIVRIDPESIHARPIFDLSNLPDFEPAGVFPLSLECDQLALFSRTDGKTSLLNLATGKLVSLGQNIRLREVAENAMIYETSTNDNKALWRLDLGQDVPPVLIGSMPFTNTRWLDDWQRGLSYDSGRLNLIDLRDSSKVWLTNAYNGAFFLLRN